MDLNVFFAVLWKTWALFSPVQLRDALEHKALTWKTFWVDHTNTSLSQKDSVIEGQQERQIKKHIALIYWTVAIRVWKGIYSEKSILTKWLQYISLGYRLKSFLESVKFQHYHGLLLLLLFFCVFSWKMNIYTVYFRWKMKKKKEKLLLHNRTYSFSCTIRCRDIDCGIGWQLPSPEHFVLAVLKIAEL